jgi:hypothetical protein
MHYLGDRMEDDEMNEASSTRVRIIIIIIIIIIPLALQPTVGFGLSKQIHFSLSVTNSLHHH